VWFVFIGVSNTLNGLEGKLPVVVSFSVSLCEFNILLNDRVRVSDVQFLKHKHKYKHKKELPNTFYFARIT